MYNAQQVNDLQSFSCHIRVVYSQWNQPFFEQESLIIVLYLWLLKLTAQKELIPMTLHYS